MNDVSLLVHSSRLLEGEEFSKFYDLEDCTKVERNEGFFFVFLVLPTKARILLCLDSL
jgi:hypothetical protein